MASVFRPWVIVLVLCVAVAVTLYAVEWVEVQRNDGYSADARRNPYLAAERFLARYGVTVQSRDGLALLDELPDTHHTLLIASSRRALSERRNNDLRDWVERGGRLILLAGDYWDEDSQSSGDALLDRLGVRVLEPPDEELSLTGDGSADALFEALINQGDCAFEGSVARIDLADQEQDVTVELGTWSYLDYSGEHEVSYAENAVGPQLLYINVGSGAVVVLTSLNLWRNTQIHCHDHAHLLRWLTDDRPVLWWLFNTEMPPLPLLLWQRFPALVLLLGLALFMWLWWSGFRVMRVPAAADPARRELVEHLDGVARFYWQQGRADRLLQALRHGVLGGAELTAERLSELSERSRIATERVRWALTESPGKDAGGFVQMVKTLHDLREVN